MSRTHLVFGDIEGKVDVLRVECTKCDRKGRYHVHLMKWTGATKRRLSRDGRLNDRCDLVCPDLPKVL